MKILVSGVAGFIGQHTAVHLLEKGTTVVGFDNLSRVGAHENLEWLREHGGNFEFVQCDIRDPEAVERLFASHADADAVVHLAAQVAVTRSVADPRHDFEVNALGTLNLLEATRRYCPETAFLYASTNKVYGAGEELGVVELENRYSYGDSVQGVSEKAPLDLHSPYACSKGAADQYVRDYARIYGLRTVVFRQSCIYGVRQLGLEDQGWIAWFTIAAILGRPVTIYGTGKQVRDLLWVGDLVAVYETALDRLDVAAGHVYNIGGGLENTLSVLELVDALRRETGVDLQPARAGWRPGDQKVFVSDIEKARDQLALRPSVSPDEGVRRLVAWVESSEDLLRRVVP